MICLSAFSKLVFKKRAARPDLKISRFFQDLLNRDLEILRYCLNSYLERYSGFDLCFGGSLFTIVSRQITLFAFLLVQTACQLPWHAPLSTTSPKFYQ